MSTDSDALLHALLDDLRAEHDDVRALVEPIDLQLPTPAAGWTVHDTVAHLAGTDEMALLAATDPAAFVASRPADLPAGASLVDEQVAARRGLSREQLLGRWHDGFEAMVRGFADVPPGTSIPWYGPPMSPASFATARLMEYWAHGTDIADAAGVVRPATDRLRHVCHLGVRTRGFAFANRGLAVPTEPVAVELGAPDGSTWRYGPQEAAERVTGPALDFCLLVTQRRHRDDTALVADGPAADAWLDVAQCFAGPPGAGRPRGTTRS
jgi:uncharacterized protein (TIGR03084 family)